MRKSYFPKIQEYHPTVSPDISVSSNLYRHRLSGLYYGFRKIAGKRRCVSLKTADRKTAERKLAEWLRDLGKVDASNPDVTLAMLIENFRTARAAKSKSTTGTEAGILKKSILKKSQRRDRGRVTRAKNVATSARKKSQKRPTHPNSFPKFIAAALSSALMALPTVPFRRLRSKRCSLFI